MLDQYMFSDIYYVCQKCVSRTAQLKSFREEKLLFSSIKPDHDVKKVVQFCLFLGIFYTFVELTQLKLDYTFSLVLLVLVKSHLDKKCGFHHMIWSKSTEYFWLGRKNKGLHFHKITYGRIHIFPLIAHFLKGQSTILLLNLKKQRKTIIIFPIFLLNCKIIYTHILVGTVLRGLLCIVGVYYVLKKS